MGDVEPGRDEDEMNVDCMGVSNTEREGRLTCG